MLLLLLMVMVVVMVVIIRLLSVAADFIIHFARLFLFTYWDVISFFVQIIKVVVWMLFIFTRSYCVCVWTPLIFLPWIDFFCFSETCLVSFCSLQVEGLSCCCFYFILIEKVMLAQYLVLTRVVQCGEKIFFFWLLSNLVLFDLEWEQSSTDRQTDRQIEKPPMNHIFFAHLHHAEWQEEGPEEVLEGDGRQR